MKAILMLITAGLVSVVLTEIVAVTLMMAIPPSVDMTGSFFQLVAGPAIAVVGIVGGLVLTRTIRSAGFAKSLLYIASYAGGQFALLSSLMNPLADRFTYLAITLTVTLLVVIWRLSGREAS